MVSYWILRINESQTWPPSNLMERHSKMWTPGPIPTVWNQNLWDVGDCGLYLKQNLHNLPRGQGSLQSYRQDHLKLLCAQKSSRHLLVMQILTQVSSGKSKLFKEIKLLHGACGLQTTPQVLRSSLKSGLSLSFGQQPVLDKLVSQLCVLGFTILKRCLTSQRLSSE